MQNKMWWFGDSMHTKLAEGQPRDMSKLLISLGQPASRARRGGVYRRAAEEILGEDRGGEKTGFSTSVS